MPRRCLHAALLALLTAAAPAAEPPRAAPASGLPSLSNYATRYGETKSPVAVDPASDLPRYPAVDPADAVATWQVKPGVRMALAAHEPEVRDPISICFDERGRLFACEMIDYSERRDEIPHLGRISVLEDRDGDGHYETSRVFADDLPWPTGLIWASGGLWVGATPDIWFFPDADGDGVADSREKVFTGFGTGLKLLNVQGLMNNFEWGLDNRIHVLAGGGNRGQVRCLSRDDLPALELGGADFWFDPRTREFGLEDGGAQFGMSFDDFGRKFGCSNSDHLQYWAYDSHRIRRDGPAAVPAPRQSIAADGGAAEVFRLSPDEPWRILRTRWRIAGVVKGVVEGGGRVSGYFTGATGTTVYRGDALGADFSNNTFTGDAGGQLVHRKILHPSADALSLVGERPADEKDHEFAASTDTWVRVVNFANAPDGCLYLCDMYREIIEHPWSVPDEIKQHLDLNSGNDRGRIYRIEPDRADWHRRAQVDLAAASTADLVATLSHPNGWHRDTAQRLLWEQRDPQAPALLRPLLAADAAAPALHALHLLAAFHALTESDLITALHHPSPHIIEHAIDLVSDLTPALREALIALGKSNPPARVWLALASLAGQQPDDAAWADTLILAAIRQTQASPLILGAALNNGRSAGALFQPLADLAGRDPALLPALEAVLAAVASSSGENNVLDTLVAHPTLAPHLPALLAIYQDALRAQKKSLASQDPHQVLTQLIEKASSDLESTTTSPAARTTAIELLAVLHPPGTTERLLQLLRSDPTSQAPILTALTHEKSAPWADLLATWPDLTAPHRTQLLSACIDSKTGSQALLDAVAAPSPPTPADLNASQVQTLLKSKDAALTTRARQVLHSVIPPSREDVARQFAPALDLAGDAAAGRNLFIGRCMACHVAEGMGMALGPDLQSVKSRGPAGILEAILDPSKEVQPQFIAYAITTRDGRMLSGIVTRDDADAVTVKQMGGLEATVPRSSIQSMTSDGYSLMPEGLETGLTTQEMADLLAFIQAL
ncbi:MAG: c-type cytochrome [Verrucomicrobiales bacterium]|nr:c-type cytochrome [Verrucomicrobiales bacterium]